MTRKLTSALVLGLLSFPAVSLVGCGEETKKETKETVSTPSGSTTTTETTKVNKTGDHKGETGTTDKPK
jgi:hypothetical protein